MTKSQILAAAIAIGLLQTLNASAAPCDGIKLEGKYRWFPLDGKDADQYGPENPTVAVPRENGSVDLMVYEASEPQLKGREIGNRGNAELRVVGNDCRLVLRMNETELISYGIEYYTRAGDLVLSSEYGSVVLKRLN